MTLAAMILAGCYGGDFAVPVRDGGTGSSSQVRLVHIVRKGDTLYSIAWDAGLDYHALARWNGISPPYVIRPGQKLRLRPGERDDTQTATKARTSPASKPSTRTTTTATRSASVPESRPGTTGKVSEHGWIWPTAGPVIRGFSRGSANPGIDIGGKPGQVVKSAAAGHVVYSGDGLRGYGQLIIVKHDETFLSAYAHNRKLLVREGDRVKRGQPIAEMGSTGTDKVKLHFEIRKQGTAVDPLQYLPKS